MLTFFEHFDYSSQQHEWFGIGTFFGNTPSEQFGFVLKHPNGLGTFLGKQVYETIHANLKGT